MLICGQVFKVNFSEGLISRLFKFANFSDLVHFSFIAEVECSYDAVGKAKQLAYWSCQIEKSPKMPTQKVAKSSFTKSAKVF